MQPRSNRICPLHLMLWPALVLAFSVLLTVATTTQARADNAPLLILADDEDPRAVTRKSALFEDLVSQLAADLDHRGFQVVDEDALLAGLGRKIPDRRTQEEQLSMVRDTVERGVQMGIRAFVQLRLSVSARQSIRFGTIRFDVGADMFRYPRFQIIDSIQLPPFEFLMPSDCNRDCISAHAKKNYVHLQISVALAVWIANRSSALVVADVATEPNRQNDADIGQGDDADMMYSSTPFTVTLRHFKRSDALSIVGVMADEFPGYEDHDLIALDSTEAQYLYVTSATRAKLLEWLNILLGDMGFEVDAIAMTFSENDIMIENTAVAPPGTEAD